MGSSLTLLQRYEEHGEVFLSRIVTGDETWVFYYTPESKTEDDLEASSLSSQKKVQVSRKSDGYCFLGCSRSSFG
jgi:hypothetical protein